MTTETLVQPPVRLIRVSGALCGADMAALRQAVAEWLAAGERDFLADLDAVPSLDTAALGQLLALFRDVRQTGGRFKLVALQASVARLFEATRLRCVFEIFNDEAVALESFHSDLGLAPPRRAAPPSPSRAEQPPSTPPAA